jgi:flagellar biosynthetic protein FlhB
MYAPAVTAKAAGDRALEMRRIARRAGVGIVEDRPLARALFRGVNIDQAIPEELYPAVAEVLAQVIRARHRDALPAGESQEPVR